MYSSTRRWASSSLICSGGCLEKKAEADKAAATKAKDAANLAKAQDRAVANYKKNKKK